MSRILAKILRLAIVPFLLCATLALAQTDNGQISGQEDGRGRPLLRSLSSRGALPGRHPCRGLQHSDEPGHFRDARAGDCF